MERIGCLAIGYILGCFLGARIAARAKTGKGPGPGFGNPGAVNSAARLGLGWGVFVLAFDAGKAAAAAFLCRPLLPGPLAALYAGLGAAAGHDFSPFARFRGGKGAAVTGAAMLLASPAAGVPALLAGLCAVWITGYPSVGAAVIAAVFPAWIAASPGGEALWVSAALCALLLARFLPDLRRAARGKGKRARRFKRPPSGQ